MRDSANIRVVIIGYYVELFVGCRCRVRATLAEEITVRDVQPASGVVGKYANADLVFTCAVFNAELEVVSGEVTVALEKIGQEIRQRAATLLRVFEIGVEDVIPGSA